MAAPAGPPLSAWSGRVLMSAALSARAAGGGGAGASNPNGGGASLLFEAAIVGSASTAASSPWPQPSTSRAGDLVVLRLLDLAAALGAAQRALALAPRGRLVLLRPSNSSSSAAAPGTTTLGAALLGWLAGAGGRPRVAALAALAPHALLIVCAADGGGGSGGNGNANDNSAIPRPAVFLLPEDVATRLLGGAGGSGSSA